MTNTNTNRNDLDSLADEPTKVNPSTKNSSSLGVVSLKWPTLLAVVLLLVLAALRPLALPDEGRYAEIGRWMGVSGDWLAPRLNGLPFFHKPPLLYWLEALVTQTLGAHAWAVRLIPALHATLLLVLMGALLKPILGATKALRSVIIFGTSAAFLLGGQYINHDMMVACWISVAISAFGCFALQMGTTSSASVLDHHATSIEQSKPLRRGKQTAWLGFIALALGVLSKGLIGVVLPAWVLFLWLCWSGRWGVLRVVPWISGTLIFSLITLPWFFLTEQHFPGMVDYMFGVHQFERFTGTQFNNAQPFWFYGAAISLLIGPWMVWFWIYQIRCIYDFFVQAKEANNKRGATQILSKVLGTFSTQNQVRRTDSQLLIGLCVIWLWAIVIFFNIPLSKIIGYALPVIPPMAVLCAVAWERLMGGVRFERSIWWTVTGLSLVLMVLVNHEAARMTRKHFSQDVANVLKCQNLQEAELLVLGEYPYDLPFLIEFNRPMWIIQDWDFERAHAGDNWRRELFEGANFEPAKGEYLKPPKTLEREQANPNRWILSPVGWSGNERISELGYVSVFKGRAWNLYRTQSTVASSTTLEGSCER